VNLPKLKKFQIKYGWREIEIGNNVSYICFSRFEMEFELKFRELGSLKGKINFKQKKIRNLNFL
jgi:hypothetical protein